MNTGSGRYIPSQQPEPRGGMSLGVKLVLLVLVAAAVAFGYKEVQKKKAEREAYEGLEAAQKELNAARLRELDEEGGIDIGKNAEALARFRKAVDKNAALGGTSGKAMGIMSEILGEMQQALVPYADLSKRIENENPFELRTLKDRETLARRRALAQEFEKLNTHILQLAESAESRLAEGFRKANLTGREADQMAEGFKKGVGRTLPYQRRIRAADAELAKCILALCDLAEKEWGKWKVEGEQIVFEANAALVQYQAIMQRVGKAAEDQETAQRELIKVQSR